jgi:hypothetical protein
MSPRADMRPQRTRASLLPSHNQLHMRTHIHSPACAPPLRDPAPAPPPSPRWRRPGTCLSGSTTETRRPCASGTLPTATAAHAHTCTHPQSLSPIYNNTCPHPPPLPQAAHRGGLDALKRDGGWECALRPYWRPGVGSKRLRMPPVAAGRQGELGGGPEGGPQDVTPLGAPPGAWGLVVRPAAAAPCGVTYGGRVWWIGWWGRLEVLMSQGPAQHSMWASTGSPLPRPVSSSGMRKATMRHACDSMRLHDTHTRHLLEQNHAPSSPLTLHPHSVGSWRVYACAPLT